MEVVDAHRGALRAQAPEGYWVGREMTVVLDDRNRPEPDVVVSTAPVKADQTWIPVDAVELDPATGAYTRTQVARGTLSTSLPFGITIELGTLVP